MQPVSRKNRIPINERAKDLKKDSIRQLYNNIINTMKEREAKVVELETAKSVLEDNRRKRKSSSTMISDMEGCIKCDENIKEETHLKEDYIDPECNSSLLVNDKEEENEEEKV